MGDFEHHCLKVDSKIPKNKNKMFIGPIKTPENKYVSWTKNYETGRNI